MVTKSNRLWARTAFFFCLMAAAMEQPVRASSATAARVLQPPNDVANSLLNNIDKGYCDYSKNEVVALNELISSHVDDIDDFLEVYELDGESFEYAIPELDEFVKLTREYLGSTKDDFTERDILQVMMQKTVEGRSSEALSDMCKTALARAILDSSERFFKLMGVGAPEFDVGLTSSSSETTFEESIVRPAKGTSTSYAETVEALTGSSFSLAVDDDIENSVDAALPLFLDIFQRNDLSVFEKFISTILFKSDVVNVKEILDREFVFFLGSWKEMVTTSASFPARYAAFALTQGAGLRAAFDEENIFSVLGGKYSVTLSRCTVLRPPEDGASNGTPSTPVAVTTAPTTTAPSVSPTPAPTTMTPAATPTVPTSTVVPTAIGNAGAASSPEDLLIPVIAVVEDVVPDAAILEASWESFRAAYPKRKFCLLQVRPFTTQDISIPSAFSADNNTIYRAVNRDENNGLRLSHWFNQCDLYDVQEGERVAILLDVPVARVLASYNYFLRNLQRRGIKREDAAVQSDGNYIEPLNSVFV